MQSSGCDRTVNSVRRLLVANRGEVVTRIARTARGMGIETVGVYSRSDEDATYLHDLNAAVALGPDDGHTPYLDIDAVLDAARSADVDAVHPGYGFLSENADFAQACIDAGLVWVGPPPKVIRTMGNKVEAKRVAAAAGVPVLASVSIDGELGDESLDALADLTFPVLVKPAAGGGGKGMHRAQDRAELLDKLAVARREALSAFGDATVLVERYVEGARHVEVQIFADTHGNVVHLGDRDCSVQRRHQKVIEETPAIRLADGLREALYSAAVCLGRAVDYVGAGTVEYLVFGDEFAFLEMNTRLQVEHAVTEEVTGVDLVEWQIEVASGSSLPVTGAPFQPRGHAIEARLYAEDPAMEFLPSPGRVQSISRRELPGVRWELEIRDDSAVNTRYDPMIAKIVASGRDRLQAINRLAGALESLRVVGVRTNRQMLLAVLRSGEFRETAVGTDFLSRRRDLLVLDKCGPDMEAFALAAAVHEAVTRRNRASVQPFTPTGWRNLYSRWARASYLVDGRDLDVHYQVRRDGCWAASIDERVLEARVLDADTGTLDIEIDRVRRRYTVISAVKQVSVECNGDFVVFQRASIEGAGVRASGDTALTAPLPGRVVSVEVSEGDLIESGAVLVVIEAMKMEHRVTAARRSRIGPVLVAAGDAVDHQQELLSVIEAPDHE